MKTYEKYLTEISPATAKLKQQKHAMGKRAFQKDVDFQGIEKIGKQIFGGCVDKTEFDGNFGTWFLNKNCNTVDVEDIKKLLKAPIDFDSIQLEKGKLIVTFFHKG